MICHFLFGKYLKFKWCSGYDLLLQGQSRKFWFHLELWCSPIWSHNNSIIGYILDQCSQKVIFTIIICELIHNEMLKKIRICLSFHSLSCSHFGLIGHSTLLSTYFRSMTDWSFHQVMQYPWGEIRNVSNVRINLQGGAKLQLCTMSVASWGDCPLLIISWVVWAWQTPSQVYKGLLFSGLQLSLLLMSRKCLSSY